MNDSSAIGKGSIGTRYCVTVNGSTLTVMNRISLLIIFVLMCSIGTYGQQRFRVMTYNVENLFDTCHDAGCDDYEFLPSAERAWGQARYFKKLGQLCRVIAAAGGESPVDLVGLCEVENDSVLRDLTEHTRLHRLGYRYLITHGPDSRGVDVGLLYQPERFRVLQAEDLGVPVDADYGRPTRDFLHVCGLLPTADTLDVLVCHMPSRRGGTQVVERFRQTAGRTLRHYADSLMQVRGEGRLLIMGDFNDECRDASISTALGAKALTNEKTFPEVSERDLYVLSADLQEGEVYGTYKYKGQWNTLDQIMVSGSLLDENAACYTRRSLCHIFAPAFLLTTDKAHGGQQPWRTYVGTHYLGGFSDHLPLTLDFVLP